MEAESRSGGGSFRPLLLVLLPAVFVLLFLPSFLSHGFRPGLLLKNGWDVLNLVLVLFAILCGLFARTREEEEENYDRIKPAQAPLATDRWPAAEATAATEYRAVGLRRMRSSSSYPDLRHEAWWGPHDADAWRFSDDIQLYRASPRRMDAFDIRKSPALPERSQSRSRSPPPPPAEQERSRSPPPPPPPPPKRRTVRKLPPAEESELPKPQRSRSPPRSAPPPPPPPPPMSPARVEVKRMERKKSGGAKDIATALAQFYQKKKKRSKSKKIHIEEPVADTGSVSVPPSAPPPPPPPPPSPSMFQQLFKKSSGSKSSKRHQQRHHHFPPPPPPPAKKHESVPVPPPPPHNPLQNRKHKPRSSSRYPLPPSPLRPSPPTYQSMPYYSIPMPPPPPPPPPSEEADEIGKEGEQGQQFCPSPDVNNKAEMFIARFRHGLHLEKLNSIKLKQEQQQQQEEENTVAA